MRRLGKKVIQVLKVTSVCGMVCQQNVEKDEIEEAGRGLDNGNVSMESHWVILGRDWKMCIEASQ